MELGDVMQRPRVIRIELVRRFVDFQRLMRTTELIQGASFQHVGHDHFGSLFDHSVGLAKRLLRISRSDGEVAEFESGVEIRGVET